MTFTYIEDQVQRVFFNLKFSNKFGLYQLNLLKFMICTNIIKWQNSAFAS